MTIKRIILSNFKSFDNLDIEIRNFNLLIGANASGKSNFIRIFEFLRDISNYGIENAISMQGGIGYLRNIDIGFSKSFSLETISDDRYSASFRLKRGFYVGIKTSEIGYKFEIKFNKRGLGYQIIDDRLIFKCDLFKLERDVKGLKDKEKLGPLEITVTNYKGRIKYSIISSEELKDIIGKIMPEAPARKKPQETTLLLESPIFGLPFDFFVLRNIFMCSIYDFDPKLPKRATPITGKVFFEEDGSNLAVVINNIIKQKESRRKFFNLIKDLLPFVEELGIEKFSDKSMLIKLREKYSRDRYLPASFISDGTLNIVALIMALYFDRKRLSVIEEPERNIHPYLISKVMNMMKDASNKKQLIVTTHNPEMVKYADLENILLVSRNQSGFTMISKPCDKESVKQFLQNEIGVADLFVKNLFE